MNNWIAPTLAMASGVLFALALPPFDVEWLGWVAMAPFLVAVSVPERRTLHAIGLGLLAGIVAGIVQIGYTPDAKNLNFAYLPFIWIGPMFGAMAAVVAAARQRWPEAHPLLGVLFVACAGVSVEWLTTLSPLPVGIALCQWRNTPLIQVASFTGIWGVSFLLWMGNAALADLILRRKPLTITAAVVGILVLFTYGYGAFTLFEVRDYGYQNRTHTLVAAVQDYNGIDGENPNGTRDGGGDVPDIETLMRQAADKGAELVVGSEEAFGSGFIPNEPGDSIALLAKEKQTHFVVGYQERGTGEKDFNCAALVAPNGKALGVHRKVHLFLGEKNAIQAGDSATVVDSGDAGIGKIGMLICFDTCWTSLTRDAVARRARIIAVPNYDPPTHHAVLHHLHAALMPFRAVENGVALVRADPNGLSMVVDPSGRISASAPMYRAEVVMAKVPLGDGKGTLFTRWGDWLAYVCIGVVAAAAVAGVGSTFSAKRRSSPSERYLP
jgi:apolipoprotein N-acyltransferase